MDIKKRFARRGRSYAQMIEDYEGGPPSDNVCAGCGQEVEEKWCIRRFQYDGDYYHPWCLVPTMKRDLAESDALIPDHVVDEMKETAGEPIYRIEILHIGEWSKGGESQMGMDISENTPMECVVPMLGQALDFFYREACHKQSWEEIIDFIRDRCYGSIGETVEKH